MTQHDNKINCLECKTGITVSPRQVDQQEAGLNFLTAYLTA